VDVLVPVDLEPGPPPLRARFIEPTAVAPRYAALREGLREQGIQVGRMAVSGEHGESITWLELAIGGPHGRLGGNPRCTGKSRPARPVPSVWGWRWWSFCSRRHG
jgi:hypothetical protein